MNKTEVNPLEYNIIVLNFKIKCTYRLHYKNKWAIGFENEAINTPQVRGIFLYNLVLIDSVVSKSLGLIQKSIDLYIIYIYNIFVFLFNYITSHK